MKKTLLRIALAAGLVGAVNWAMTDNSEAKAAQINVSVQAPDDYTIVDENHPNYLQQFDASQINAQCPSGSILCAEARAGSGLPDVTWSGSTTKF